MTLMLNVNDFVKWAYGNLLNNTTRAVVAEYLVHKALNSSTKQRIDWDAYDILYKGYKMEVKSSGYLQTWNKEGHYSSIKFDISKKDPWISENNKYLGSKCRYSDLWVFCVHLEKDIARANSLDETQWEFYCATSKWIDKEFGDQKSVGLSILVKKGLQPVGFNELKSQIDNIIEKQLPG